MKFARQHNDACTHKDSSTCNTWPTLQRQQISISRQKIRILSQAYRLQWTLLSSHTINIKVCHRSIIYARGCERNISNRIFSFLFFFRCRLANSNLSRSCRVRRPETVGDLSRGAVRPRANARNLVGGNVGADKRVGYHREVRSLLVGSGTALRRRASRPERRDPRGGTGTFLARGARRGMAKKRGDPVTSRDSRGGAASLSLGRRRSARSVHRARRLRRRCVRLLSSRSKPGRDRWCPTFRTVVYVLSRESNNGGETKTNNSLDLRRDYPALYFSGHTYSSTNGSDTNGNGGCATTRWHGSRTRTRIAREFRSASRLVVKSFFWEIFLVSWLCDDTTLWIRCRMD